MGSYQETLFLILRKTPYSESSLILAGLSPECGQLHFLVRGGRQTSRRQFTGLDLFRLLKVQFVRKRSELQSFRQAESLEDFSGMTRRLAAFQAAGWLARFTLANVPEGLAAPRYFMGLVTALRRLAASAGEGTAGEAVAAVVAGVTMLYLDEHGLLPEYRNQPEQARQREWLLQMACGAGGIPPYSPEEWRRLQDWIDRQLQNAECRLPPWDFAPVAPAVPAEPITKV